jgi:hypothetical protein
MSLASQPRQYGAPLWNDDLLIRIAPQEQAKIYELRAGLSCACRIETPDIARFDENTFMS